jgi:RNA polymerase sigma-70 factor (ECF subfamily)
MVEKRTPGEVSIRDYQLVVQAISGDQKAYAELMALYEDPVYHALLKRVGDPMVAEDLTIETFGKAFRNLHRFCIQYLAVPDCNQSLH